AQFINVTLTNNHAESRAGFYNYQGTPHFKNSILYGNTNNSGGISNVNITATTEKPTFSYSLVEGAGSGWTNFGINGGNNIFSNPMFTNPSGNVYTLMPASGA